MARAAAEAWKYGDPEAHDLRAAIAARHCVDARNVTVGEGIDGLLGNLVRLLVAPGDPVVTSLGAYPTFGYHVAGFGGIERTVSYRADRQDLEGLLAAVRETGARLIYLANPDNPMGGWFAADAIAAFIDELPGDTVLCLDEAYADFMADDALVPLDMDEARVIRMRTFSKAHGLAGARVGYALGRSDMIAAFDRVRNHFGVGRISQAGALAALDDLDWLARVVADVERSKARLASIARAGGLAPLPSATNFVTMDCGRDGAFARRVLAELAVEGVFVRMPFVAPQDRCIRVTAGLDAHLDIFEAALPVALSRAAGQG
jgi:histidinol-phosphate aminotransferase